MSFIEFSHVTKKYREFTAVRDLSFDLEKNEALGLVGESGCGKTTIAGMLLGLVPHTEGQIFWEGRDTNSLNRRERKEFCRNVQVVFQDTAASLNPRLKVFESIAEPIRNFEKKPKAVLREQVGKLLEDVGLPASCMDQYPRSFSGGQRQRIAIARALAIRPKLMILDEATSNLDVSIQAQILNLLIDIRKQYSLSYLMISHDLGVVRYLCDRILVLKDGVLVENLLAEDLDKAKEPYTRLLLESVPGIQKRVRQ